MLIHQNVAAGRTFTNLVEMVKYLQNKFKDNQFPLFYFKELDNVTLDQHHVSSRLINFP